MVDLAAGGDAMAASREARGGIDERRGERRSTATHLGLNEMAADDRAADSARRAVQAELVEEVERDGRGRAHPAGDGGDDEDLGERATDIEGALVDECLGPEASRAREDRNAARWSATTHREVIDDGTRLEIGRVDRAGTVGARRPATGRDRAGWEVKARSEITRLDAPRQVEFGVVNRGSLADVGVVDAAVELAVDDAEIEIDLGLADEVEPGRDLGRVRGGPARLRASVNVRHPPSLHRHLLAEIAHLAPAWKEEDLKVAKLDVGRVHRRAAVGEDDLDRESTGTLDRRDRLDLQRAQVQPVCLRVVWVGGPSPVGRLVARVGRAGPVGPRRAIDVDRVDRPGRAAVRDEGAADRRVGGGPSDGAEPGEDFGVEGLLGVEDPGAQHRLDRVT